MKKLKDLDSHEQSVQKLEFCLFQYEEQVEEMKKNDGTQK